MIFKKQAISAFALLFLMLALAACDKGPAEKLGEDLDDATTKMGNQIEDACEEAKKSAGADDTDC